MHQYQERDEALTEFRSNMWGTKDLEILTAGATGLRCFLDSNLVIVCHPTCIFSSRELPCYPTCIFCSRELPCCL